jgi:hypothetical protein
MSAVYHKNWRKDKKEKEQLKKRRIEEVKEEKIILQTKIETNNDEIRYLISLFRTMACSDPILQLPDEANSAFNKAVKFIEKTKKNSEATSSSEDKSPISQENCFLDKEDFQTLNDWQNSEDFQNLIGPEDFNDLLEFNVELLNDTSATIRFDNF